MSKKPFEPIAIVGRGCILPGADNPHELWNLIAAQKVVLREATTGDWQVDPKHILKTAPGQIQKDAAWTSVGGYLNPISPFADDRHGQLDPALDNVFHLTAHAVRQALETSGWFAAGERPHTGLIMGNLGYAVPGFTDWTAKTLLGEEHVNLSQTKLHPANRFMSALPIHYTADLFGFNGPRFALDAACASGLYAIKYACDYLQAGTADVMVAGGINYSDILHTGFASLGALSHTGQSRPFNQGADGLIPARGVAVVVLKRLQVAIAHRDPILGVIRGIGLSNDGRAGSFLSPSSRGQLRALQQAYAAAAIDPKTISYIECHATGTQLGDATEVETLGNFFTAGPYPKLGALKACIGHTVTASGAAGLLKVLGAFEHDCLPGTPNITPLNPCFADGPWDVPSQNQPWTDNKRAGVSSFGFGGNNAHLIVEAWDPQSRTQFAAASPQHTPQPGFAVVGLEVRTHRSRDYQQFQEQLQTPVSEMGQDQPITHIELAQEDLVVPPADLQAALGQQLLIAHATSQALNGITFEPGSTGVYIGMQCDGVSSRYYVRERLPHYFQAAALTEAQLERCRDAIVAPCFAAHVLGAMPNVVTNRLNHQFSLQGQSHSIFAEELSGDVALEIALQALTRGEISTAVVGAVDMCREVSHQAAAAELLPAAASKSGDAAVVLVIKTLDQARADQDTILAELTSVKAASATNRDTAIASTVYDRFGHAHCAQGLLHLAAGIALANQKKQPNRETLAPIFPNLDERTVNLCNQSFTGDVRCWQMYIPPSAQWDSRATDPQHRLLRAFAADSPEALLALLQQKQRVYPLVSGAGGTRAIVLGKSRTELDRAHKELAQAITQNPSKDLHTSGGMYYPQALGGKLAITFTAATMAYPGAGIDLLPAFPSLLDTLIERHGTFWDANVPSKISTTAGKHTASTTPPDQLKNQLKVVAIASQIHACLSLNLLGLQPQAALGLSSGESNALLALGVWTDMQCLLADIDRSLMYERYLAGEFQSVRAFWGLTPEAPLDFCTWMVLASPAAVQAAIGTQKHVYLTIINSDEECVIAGERYQCQQVIKNLSTATAIPLDFDFCCHCPPLQPFRDTWWQIHHRPVIPVEGVQIYANHLGQAYERLDAAAIADAITGQALATVDFPRTVRQSWEDGVRIYLEHGPRNRLTVAIDKILHDKPHLALALDHPQEPVHQVYRVASELWAAGVEVDLTRLHRQAKRALAGLEPTVLKLALYPPAVELAFILAEAKAASIERNLSLASSVAASARSQTPITPTQPIKHLMPPPPARPETLQVATPIPHQNGSQPQANGVQPTPLPPALEVLQQIQTVHTAYLRQQQQAQQTFLQLSQSLWQSRSQSTERLPAPPTTQPVVTSTPQQPDQQSDRDPTLQERMAAELKRLGPATSALWEWPDMLELAQGKISKVFGPEFQAQDGYKVQVRLPEPPLLLCERVLAIDAVPKSMGTGTIWTEHTVTPDKWYLHFGHMPAGIFIECGQADLTLISYLGIDFFNQGKRMYRLLGCEITWLGPMPKVGETLKYEIRVTGHAQQGDVRLFFFEYDCWIDGQRRAQVRHGRAGFFTPQELQESKGAIWEPSPERFRPHPTLLAPPCLTPKRAFNQAEVLAYTRGELWHCFGEAFAFAKTHHRSPRSEAGPLNFIQTVTHFEPQGGPVGRGYLRAVQTITPQGCFMEGHFLNDPCMPGTLMANGCCQMLAFYLTALGFTLQRDGWRFAPKPNQPTTYICRNEVNPASKELVYEIFVDDIVSEDGVITLYAHGVCTVDGLKALLAENFALCLVPGWPGDCWPANAWETRDDRPLAYIDNLPLDYASLMHCALGDPTKAFGAKAACYTGVVPSLRLPNLPYHFMSRITKLEGTIGNPTVGSQVELLYDISPDAWYFKENANPVMPFCVLMEIALQPCGWLFTYNLPVAEPLQRRLFRNLDGEGQVYRAIGPSDRTVRTIAKLTAYSEIGAMIISKFTVQCYVESDIVFTLNTAFGFFPPTAFEQQKGIEIQPEENAVLNAPANLDLDLSSLPPAYFGKGSKLPTDKLRMLDRVTGYWPHGGKAGKGQWRAEKYVDPGDWYFKAHFYSDPVQPGSLGVEAILQLVQLHMLHRKLHKGLSQPCFLPCLSDRQTEWHYRGQVVPHDTKVIFDIEILAEGTCENGHYVEAEGRLWLNGYKFYHVPKIGIRLVDGSAKDQSIDVEDPLNKTQINKNQQNPTTSPEENFEDLLNKEPKAVLPTPSNLIARVIIWLAGFLARCIWPIEVFGQEHLLLEAPFILCANHESHFDPFWVTSCVPPPLRYQFCTLAKKEHFQKPMTRLFVNLIGGIPVDRQGDSLPALRTAAQGLREKRPLFIHPEGTRTRTGKLLPFKGGAAKLAIATGSPMIPVRIIGAYEIFPPDQRWPSFFDWKRWRRHQLKIVFGTPIEPSKGARGLQAEMLLTEQLRQAIIELHSNAS